MIVHRISGCFGKAQRICRSALPEVGPGSLVNVGTFEVLTPGVAVLEFRERAGCGASP